MKKNVDIFFHLKLQDTTYLNREILQGKSLQATTLYEWLFWYLSSNVFLEALFEQGTCGNNSHKAIFFAKKKYTVFMCVYIFCMYILVCTCLYTYISVCGYLHMLTHVQLYAHTMARGYHQVPSWFALCLLFMETDSFEELILQDELVSKLQESSHPLPLHSHNYRQGPSYLALFA